VYPLAISAFLGDENGTKARMAAKKRGGGEGFAGENTVLKQEDYREKKKGFLQHLIPPKKKKKANRYNEAHNQGGLGRMGHKTIESSKGGRRPGRNKVG